ncbi:hypothetical protein ACFXKY_34875 [Streptomyces canus]|uniref:hypothetical protein n=1 Tax=Streptomyces canus TaxID=58343 RepID=UPI0036CDF290
MSVRLSAANARAWSLLPVGLVLLAVTAGRRSAWRAALAALSVVTTAVAPVALADPPAFVEHVVLFPLGAGGVRSPATSPPPDRLLALYVPGGCPVPSVRRRTGWRSAWGSASA